MSYLYYVHHQLSIFKVWKHNDILPSSEEYVKTNTVSNQYLYNLSSISSLLIKDNKWFIFGGPDMSCRYYTTSYRHLVWKQRCFWPTFTLLLDDTKVNWKENRLDHNLKKCYLLKEEVLWLFLNTIFVYVLSTYEKKI